MVTTARNKWGTKYLYLVCSGRTRRVTNCDRQAMPVDLIEELLEDEYRTIAFSPELHDTVEQLVLDDFDDLQTATAAERQQLERQRVDLTAQRRKLLDAHYADAIPLDLLKVEQQRIGSQLDRIQQHLATADADYERARALLADTLDLTRDCHTAYQQADDNTRRLFNQAFFTKIYIDEDDESRERSIRVDYNPPFDDPLNRLVPAHVHQRLQNDKTAHPGGGTQTTLRVAGDCQENGVSGSTRRPAGWRGGVTDDRNTGGREPIED